MKPNPEQLAALELYCQAHGRYWKQALKKAWREGTDDQEVGGAYLRQLRNNFGPRWLDTYQGEKP